MPLDEPFLKKNFARVATDLLTDIASGGGGRQPLTDATEGSVVRTLAEAFARELAVCYEQLDHVYRNAYLETAEGGSLDNVVALLGLKRRRGGYLEGVALFSRLTPAPEDIHIPAGTLVAGRDAPPCATIEPAVLARGERAVSVGIRAQETTDKPVIADQLNVMPRPIAGIESVRNPGDLLRRQREETDAELRLRAQGLVRAANTGTVSAIEEAARSAGISEVHIIEQPGGQPGMMTVVLGDAEIPDPVFEEAQNRIEAVRPAGIFARCERAVTVYAQITATLEVDSQRDERERKAIEATLTQQLADYVGQLAIGATLREAKIRAILTGHEAVIGVEPTGNLPLLTPYAFGEDGKLVPNTERYLVDKGDISPGLLGRVQLDQSTLPPRLSLEPSTVKARLAVRLTAQGSDGEVAPATRAALENALRQLVEQINKTIQEQQAGQLSSAALATALLKADVAGALREIRITVTHDRDGRALELGNGKPEVLQANDRSDGFGNREQLLLEPIQWVVGQDG
ncbi:baseplate J/gp47 family protein [Chitiniphilus shinanonensis]|uniref:baseplate J/gp47 family protein n=1 Tax=Chitiniphilus shinanonensis TaxID=553088 RepID=UPI00302B6DB5